LEIERTQVVVGVGVVGLCEQDLPKRRFCLLEISMLIHGHAVGKVVALKSILREDAFEWQRFLHTSSGCGGDGTQVCLKVLDRAGPRLDAAL